MKGEVLASQFLRPHLRGDSCDEFLELGEASHYCDGDQLLISQTVRPDSSLQLDRYERQTIDQGR